MPTTERTSGIVVIQPVRAFVCAECGGGRELLRMQDAGPLCLACSDLDHLVFVPSGDAALTRRAGRALDEDAIVLAVVAAIRYQDTGYDSLLMKGVPRDVVRNRVRSDIDRVLTAWRTVGSRKDTTPLVR